MCNFNIGQKVVCIDDQFPLEIKKFYTDLPTKDVTYVVRDIRLGVDLKGQGEVSILLIGLVNPKAESKAALERGFRADRFRPLEEIQDENREITTKTETKKEETPVEKPELQPA